MSDEAQDKAERKRLKKLKKLARQQEQEAAEAAEAAEEEAAAEEQGEKKKKKKKKNREAASEAPADGDDDSAEAAAEDEPPRKKSKKSKEAAAAQEDGDGEEEEDDGGEKKKKKKKKHAENPDKAFVAHLSKDKVSVGDKAAAASGQKIKKAFYKEHKEVASMSHAVRGCPCGTRASGGPEKKELRLTAAHLPLSVAGRGGDPGEAADLRRVQGWHRVQAHQQVRARGLLCRDHGVVQVRGAVPPDWVSSLRYAPRSARRRRRLRTASPLIWAEPSSSRRPSSRSAGPLSCPVRCPTPRFPRERSWLHACLAWSHPPISLPCHAHVCISRRRARYDRHRSNGERQDARLCARPRRDVSPLLSCSREGCESRSSSRARLPLFTVSPEPIVASA